MTRLLQGTIAGATMVMMAAALPVVADATHLTPPSEATAADARQRLALADKQRALVEEIAELSCLVALDTDVEASLALVAELTGRIDHVLTALRNGDSELGLIGEEHYSKVIRALDKTEAAWAPYRTAAQTVIASGTVSDAEKPVLFEGDYAVLDALSVLVSTIESAYANPADMMMADAVLIDLVGRQEMTAQAIGKDVCLLVLGWEVDAHREALTQNLQIFDATHDALTNGMPAMGIKPAPTPEIKAALDAFLEVWAPQRAFADRVLADETVEPAEVRDFLKANIRLLSDLDAILDLYAQL